MTLGFLGGGNMALAIIGGLLKQGYAAGDIRVAELSAEQRERLSATFGVRVGEDVATILDADVIVLAVKPQQMHAALADWPALRAHQLVLSIAAGIRAGDLSRWLRGHAAVVRAMPNTPALIGQGVSGLYALPGVSAEQRLAAERILGSVGEAHWVTDETQIDAITAISGSGPAYVFYFIEALEQAAVSLGLPADTARALALGTFQGAAALASRGEAPPAELRARVTSKGGTTEQGLRVLAECHVDQAILQAARAAARRAQELGDALGDAHAG